MENKRPIYNNCNKKGKFLGIIDYKSVVVLVVYVFLVITILKVLALDIKISIYLFMFLVVPIITLIFININNESAIEVLYTIIIFATKRKIYLNMMYKNKMKRTIYKRISKRSY